MGTRKTHGRSKTPQYQVWRAMKKRCLNSGHKEFHLYGGRGITVCERWMKFENFLADMGERPLGLSLDRIDNDKGYEPSNCRWATSAQQTMNRRRGNRFVTVGDQSLTVSEWSRQLGLCPSAIQHRIRSGLSPELAVTKARYQL